MSARQKLGSEASRVRYIRMDRSVREAIRLLAAPDVDALIVVDGPCDDTGSFIGILSDREIFRVMAREGLETLDSLVWMLTTPEFVSADVRTPLADRLQLFCTHKTNHIAIMNGMCLHSIQSIWDCVVDASHASTV
ncbi:hypothetical protein ASG51_21415 [Methylobacterium sp. Leaf465]|uniref:CBS domain-containing protein n=1 Tax=unclassified Methylobacterium TaxID=2615210 RepID=UPI0006F52073|nr:MULTISPECIES: CBS domain-containing protein [unclassified Methylobacterium]KQO66358.1 hypothetical protein ASF18_12750 [Methylobacterium sp. Leaf89]KQP59782.1 hypothetical protein ASF41_08600 [Methylobacterium sp. Leaf111]KQT80181.1 hypothetical protein ASG51_21415 [Methylobacterium sp. Leaf465]